MHGVAMCGRQLLCAGQPLDVMLMNSLLPPGLFPHPCYENVCTHQDLVIPMYKVPGQYENSPLMGTPWKKREILLFFRGDVGTTRLKW